MSSAAQFRLVRPDAAQAMLGLQVLMGGAGDLVENFLEYARQQNLDLTRQVLAVADETIVGMCLWVGSPGRTALLFTPRAGPGTGVSEGAVTAAVQAALEEARAAGILLVQAMVEPGDTVAAGLLGRAGLRLLARLIYMERTPPLLPPHVTLPADLHLESYSAAAHGAFCEAITRSYENTLDCPALAGLRDVEDVLTGHQAVGRFDPQLWSVLLLGGRPAGCLLLAEIPARNALELVYLGLAPEARGRGLGRTLMQRVLAIGARRHFGVLSLAVDAANAPALALYRRVGYRPVAERAALIRTL